MEAREKSFKSIMQESNFIQIPFFQRKYVWKRENWEQFFDDLKNSYETKKNIFWVLLYLKDTVAIKVI